MIELKHRVECEIAGPVSSSVLQTYAVRVMREAEKHGAGFAIAPTIKVDPDTQAVTLVVEWKVGA